MSKSLFILIVLQIAYSLANDLEPKCDPGEDYMVQHNKYCDRFYACRNGKAHLYQCEDGFAYVPCRGCKLLHLADCSTRPLLQPPKPTRDCPRFNGIFNDPKGCGRYVKCVNGVASYEKCSSDFLYDDKTKSCRQGSEEEISQCKKPAFLGCDKGPDGQYTSCYWYRCPVQNEQSSRLEEISLHSFPGNCQFYIICGKGGQVQIGKCDEGHVFNPVSKVCDEDKVAACRPKLDPRLIKLF